MTIWTHLVQTALLGTQRQDPSELWSQIQTSPFAALIGPDAEASPEVALLTLAGALTLYDIAGQQPAQVSVRRPAGPEDERRPLLPETLEAYLPELIDGRHNRLFPLFLEKVNEIGFLAPPHLLPNLLEKGSKLLPIRPLLLPFLGNRGRWLASQRAGWSYASFDMDTWSGINHLWEQFSQNQQIGMLRQLRSSAPTRALKLLESRWRTCSDIHRLQLLKTLDTGLSMADEPFLETALADRNHLVRRKAAELLAQLPQSRLVQRMITYVPTFLTLAEGELQVRFPREISPNMIHDGIMPVSKEQKLMRIRTRQLAHVVSAIPLTYWETEWGLKPEEMIQKVADSKWPRTLLSALIVAVRQQDNELWAERLVVYYEFNTKVNRLIGHLTPEQMERVVDTHEAWFDPLKRPLKIGHPFLSVLQFWPQAWPDTLGEHWLTCMANLILDGVKLTTMGTQLRTSFSRILEKTDPALLETAESLLLPAIEQNESWRKTVTDQLALFRYRRNMLEAIAQAAQDFDV